MICIIFHCVKVKDIISFRVNTHQGQQQKQQAHFCKGEPSHEYREATAYASLSGLKAPVR